MKSPASLLWTEPAEGSGRTILQTSRVLTAPMDTHRLAQVTPQLFQQSEDKRRKNVGYLSPQNGQNKNNQNSNLSPTEANNPVSPLPPAGLSNDTSFLRKDTLRLFP